jgi:SAM-dependent methyltransferase
MSYSKKIFMLYGKYYDLIYQKKNYQKETNYIDKLLEKFNHNNKNILEFGSGTGGHAKFLVQKGYKVHGIEKSINMIANCKKIKGFTFQNGDICKINLKRKYDIVLSLFHVLSYQTTKTNINNFFKNARHHLKPNGLLGFDFWYTIAVKSQKPKTKFIELKKKNFRLIRLAEPSKNYLKNIINVNYTIIFQNLKKNLINVVKESHQMRHFSLSDLRVLFKKHNFKCLHLGELISNNKPSKNTWGIFCLLKKY